MRPIAVLIIVSLPCLLGAQIPAEVEDYIDKFGTNNLNVRADNTIGSPYVFEEFVTGLVYFADDTRSTERMINYNCHDNQVLYRDGEDIYLLNARMIDSLEFRIGDNTSWIFTKVALKDDGDPIFMNVLYRDHSILYKRHYKEFREADVGKAYGSGQRNDEYIDRHDYYIALGRSDVQPLRPRKRNVLEIMEAYGEEIEDFLKNEKINLRSESDLIRLISYYDSLITRSQ
jgi:hypothetical protein